MDFYYMLQNRCERLEHEFCALKEELIKVKQENENMAEQLSTLQPLRIDKIEYKIHELHVQELSGTLNLGITAQADEAGVQELVGDLIKENKCAVTVGETITDDVNDETD